MRLFVALEIPAEVRENLAALIRELRAIDAKPKWVRPQNLHVTLKFIGEVDAAKSEAIRAALAGVPPAERVELSFRGVGFFPSEKRARVFWAGVDAPPHLASLAGAIDAQLEKLGISPEKRPFTPHLTLARLEPPGMPDKLRAAVAKNVAREFGVLRTCEFHLIESKLKPTGAEYTTLQSFPFAAEA
jgi:RNA 2',3'-cyclic 3'-phosphodiesterase